MRKMRHVLMSESDMCPYCGATITISGQVIDQQARMLKCPNCGATVRYVPGFGLVQSSEEGRRGPSDISTQPPTRSPSVWSSGPAITTPSTQPTYHTPKKEFDQTSECIKGCSIICILCIFTIFILFALMLFSLRLY